MTSDVSSSAVSRALISSLTVEFSVQPLPFFLVGKVAGKQQVFNAMELVVRGNQIAFPVCITLFDRSIKRRTFQQNAQVRNFGEIVSRNRHNEKSALFHRIDKPFTRKPVQGLAQCGHAGFVSLFQAIEL